MLQLGAGGWSERSARACCPTCSTRWPDKGSRPVRRDAHPAAAPLATLAVELAPDDTAKATVDIEVRDAVTRKRVRRDVDLSRIPDDGRAAAIAIEADELLRASWAEVALDTARARQAQAGGPTAGRRQRAAGDGAVARGERRRAGRARRGRALLRRQSTLVGADGVGRVRPVAARSQLEIAGALRARSVGDRAARPGERARRRAAAWRCCVRVGGRPARVARRGRRRRRRAGSSSAPSRRRARRRPSYANLLAVGSLRWLGRLALGRSVHARRRARPAASRCAAWRRPTPVQVVAQRARRRCWARRSDWRRREPRPRAARGRPADRGRAGAGGCTRSGEVLRPSRRRRPGRAAADRRPRWPPASVTPARSRAGALRCWGDNGDGQLGVAARRCRHRAGAGDRRGRSVDRARGGQHATPARWPADGGVWCWGGNANGQLGSGDRTSRAEPRQVTLPAQAVDVRTGFEFTCAVLADASVWCWGYNWEGQLGLGDTHPGDDHLEPIQLGTERDWTFVATGQGHGCGIRSPGRLYCWGRNTEVAARSGRHPAAADPRARAGRQRHRLG